MSAPTETSAGTAAIRPFKVPVTSEAELEVLRARRGHPLARRSSTRSPTPPPTAAAHRTPSTW